MSAEYYLKRVHEVLNNRSELVLTTLNKSEGETDGRTIWIDFRDRIIPAVIHECLHIAYPDWEERLVSLTENEIISMMTVRQAKNLLVKFCDKVKFCDDLECE